MEYNLAKVGGAGSSPVFRSIGIFRWYMPRWHIAGRLLEAGEGELPVAPGVTAGFATDMGPFLRNFPEPCFQCWLSVTLPWVLEEPADEAADDRDDEVKTLDRRTES